MDTKNPLIIALDVDSAEQALKLIAEIGPAADFYKIGMELYAASGMDLVKQVSAFGKKVFLDLKLYDIGETVKRATRILCQNGLVQLLTIHGSSTVMKAAVEGRGNAGTRLLAVTVLTSFDETDLRDLGYTVPVSELVALRVRKAMESAIDGIVCSPLEVARVREIGGPNLTLVTPGVRSAGASQGDQKRVATPAEAMRNGADYLVVGRQVTRSESPRKACEDILGEIGATQLSASRRAN
jgi:orotidine-5'-phosphate decarboxylase